MFELTGVDLMEYLTPSGLIVAFIGVEGCYGNLCGNTFGSLGARPRHVKSNYPEYPDELKKRRPSEIAADRTTPAINQIAPLLSSFKVLYASDRHFRCRLRIMQILA